MEYVSFQQLASYMFGFGLVWAMMKAMGNN